MSNVWTITRRELGSYFATPIAAIFIVIFIGLAAWFTFSFGGFAERGQADLQGFFFYHTFLYVFLVPAISMRLWSEERRSGTIELLSTLPISTGQAVVGKFLAAWLFAGLALALTFPMWWMVNYLGSPDNGVILTSYIGSFLMAGAYMSIGAFISSLTKNQVIAFVLSLVLCLLFALAGLPMVLGAISSWAPQAIVDLVASLGFLTRFEGWNKGMLELSALLYFGSLIALMLFLNTLALTRLKAS